MNSLWEYLTMATLSLYFFNLLPLPFLDGTELLRAFLEMGFEGQNDAFMFDVESLNGGQNNREGTRLRRRWKEKVIQALHYVLTGTLLCYVPVAIMNASR